MRSIILTLIGLVALMVMVVTPALLHHSPQLDEPPAPRARHDMLSPVVLPDLHFSTPPAAHVARQRCCMINPKKYQLPPNAVCIAGSTNGNVISVNGMVYEDSDFGECP